MNELKTAVVEVEIEWNGYIEYIDYRDITFKGLKLSVSFIGEIWNPEDEAVKHSYSSCYEKLGKITFIVTSEIYLLNQVITCAESLVSRNYDVGISGIGEEFEVLFLNETVDSKFNGSMILSFPLRDIHLSNVYIAEVFFENGNYTVEYPDLPVDWGSVNPTALLKNKDESQSPLADVLGLSFYQFTGVLAFGFVIMVILRKT